MSDKYEDLGIEHFVNIGEIFLKNGIKWAKGIDKGKIQENILNELKENDINTTTKLGIYVTTDGVNKIINKINEMDKEKK